MAAISIGASLAALPANAVLPRSGEDTIYGSFSRVNTGPSYGLSLPVTSLAIGDDTLYVGGGFNAYGDDSMITSVSTAGGPWRPLDQGMDGPNGTYVSALTFADGTLYAGGSFPGASGVPGTTHVAAWSGGAWHSMASDDTAATNGNLSGLAEQAGTLYATGEFTSIGGVPARHVAKWADDTWTAMGPGLLGFGPGYEIATSADSVYVAGNFRGVVRWDGSGWSALPGIDADPNAVKALVTHGNTLYVGGDLSITGDTSAMNHVAAYRSGAWQALGEGLDRPVNALAMDIGRGLLYAGGPFNYVAPYEYAYLAKVWDEGISTWVPLDDSVAALSPFSYSGVPTAIAPNGSVVYFGGGMELNDPSSSYIAKWTWDPPTGSNTLTGSSGQSVAITGIRFVGVPTTGGVTFGSTPVTYTRSSTSAISAVIPSCMASGTYDVKVNAVGGEASVGTVTVTYNDSACHPPSPPGPTPTPTPSTSSTVTPVLSPTVSPTLTPPSAQPVAVPGSRGVVALIGGQSVPVTRSPGTPGGPFTISAGAMTVRVTPPPTGFSAGGSNSVTMSGFAPNSGVGAFLYSDPVSLGTLTVGADGVATGRIVIPATVHPGRHTLQFTGWTSAMEPAILSAAITVGPQVRKVVTVVSFPHPRTTLGSAQRKEVGRFVTASAALVAPIRTSVAYAGTGTRAEVRDAKARAQAVVAALRARGIPGSIRLGPASSSKASPLRPGQVRITATD